MGCGINLMLIFHPDEDPELDSQIAKPLESKRGAGSDHPYRVRLYRNQCDGNEALHPSVVGR